MYRQFYPKLLFYPPSSNDGNEDKIEVQLYLKYFKQLHAVKTDSKESGQDQKLTADKKSTIFELSS